MGKQERTDDDLAIIAHSLTPVPFSNLTPLPLSMNGEGSRSGKGNRLSWFDVIAVQECTAGRPGGKAAGGIYALGAHIPPLPPITARFRLLPPFSGEIAFPPSLYHNITLPGNAARFDGFDRTPYLASFKLGKSSIVLVNVHLFFGSESKADMDRRALETFAMAKWCDSRRKSTFSFTRELAAMGDFNMPMAQAGDPVFDALTKLGLEVPDHSTQIASSIMSDAHYDQVAFFPGTTQNCFTGRKGVFDYDAVVFGDLFGDGGKSAMAKFKAWCRYHISDHRPMWVELSIP